VNRALHMLDKLRDIVQGSPGLRLPRSRAVTLKARRRAVARRLSSPPAQRLVDDLAERPASALRFRLELGRHVIEGQRRPHERKLQSRHHDVEGFGPPVRITRAMPMRCLVLHCHTMLKFNAR
jgi:hypothetical protein